MDDPALAPDLHRQALRGLSRINWISASDRILWGPIARLAKETSRPLRVLDIAAGGGDVSIRLWRRARAAQLPIEFHGVDISPIALDHARRNAERAGAAVEFQRLDVFHDDLPDGFDVITSSLFLHHLEESEARRLLAAMARAARSMVLVNDLIRCRLGYVAAWIGTRILSRSPIAHVDGPLSVQAAFTRDEALALANAAGLGGATTSWRWPFRFLLEWRRR
jgi:2-polyprenyl-3-methyl-5-hydroxy-6-metoxy-1,4-benzoquinol methylase